jgi:glucose-6-phosphate 1-dehydrogenase
MEIPPTVIVIFGGAGDLTWRKLIPSLFDLKRDGRMPPHFAIVAVDRIPMTDAALRKRLLDGVKKFARP